MSDDFAETHSLVELSEPEERRRSLARLFTSHRQRLRLFVELRLDRRLRTVVDPSDVLQEAFIVASKRLEEYAASPKMPVFLWLRLLTGQRLHEIHGEHFGVQKRDPRREVRLDAGVGLDASADALAARLADGGASPSEIAARAEGRERVERAVERLAPADREILALRLYESLSSAEAARVLGIKEDTARKRYLRSMKRLKESLEE